MIDKHTLPRVAYEMMNEVHYEEVDLLNRIETALDEAKVDHEKIDALLNEMLEHTHTHFANEETLMKETGFPAFMMHQGEHIRVLNEMKRIVIQWEVQRDTDIIRNYFLGTLQEWLIQHINTMDTVTAQFICMHKGCA